MIDLVDWDAEALIGYDRPEPISREMESGDD